MDVVKLTREEVLAKYGKHKARLMSFYRMIFTFGVFVNTRDGVIKLLVTVGDGTAESLQDFKLPDAYNPVEIYKLPFHAVEVYDTTFGVKLIEEF